MILPSFAIGLIPSNGIGIMGPIILCILRFFQGLPAGGELPGAMCYLAESAPAERRSYVCSFSFFGPQIGVIISMVECYLFEMYIPHEALISWGWRLSFIIGGVLGLIGFYIRHKLKETPAFTRLEENRKVLHKPIMESIYRYKKDLAFGFFASILAVIGFYMFTIFLGIYFNKVLKISMSENLLIAIGMMTISTITLPLLGKLGDRYQIRQLLKISALGILVFSYPFYLAASSSSILFTTLFELILLVFLNIQFAILPCFIAELFPTSTRYTGIGMSFNLCDSLLGGVTPILALYLTNHIGDVAAFVFLLSFASIISLTTFFFIRNRQLHAIE